MIELYQTKVHTKMTVAMERLAVIAAVTLPVTALASIYGMNVIVNESTHWTQLAVVLVVMADDQLDAAGLGPPPGLVVTDGRGACHDGHVRVILNIIWLVLCGFWLAIGYVVAGIVCCILIITIPFGIASFRIASYALWPFGRTDRATSRPRARRR